MSGDDSKRVFTVIDLDLDYELTLGMVSAWMQYLMHERKLSGAEAAELTLECVVAYSAERLANEKFDHVLTALIASYDKVPEDTTRN